MIKQIQNLEQALKSKTALKVIAGINNFDKARVLQIAKAAELTGATCVDICAQEDIVRAVIAECPKIAIVVSSVKVPELVRAAELGAHVLELGNYEALHAEGIYPSAKEIRELTVEITKGLNELALNGRLDAETRPLVSVTVPGHIDMLEQINLSEWLEAAGVNIIQTEGASLVDSTAPGALGQIEKVKLTLATTVELARVLSERCYLLTASGINPETAPLAIAAGAHGIGVGKYINKLESDIEIYAAIMSLKNSIATKSAEAQSVTVS